MVNESAISFNWLKEQIGLNQKPLSRTVQSWNRIREEMRSVTQSISSTQIWVSDFWMCKGSKLTFGRYVAKWTPPDNLDDWSAGDAITANGTSTNYSSFLNILSGAAAAVDSAYDSNEAVQRFYLLDDATRTRGDIPMHQAQYVRAWLFTALGSLLMSVPLAPQHQPDQISKEILRRLGIANNSVNNPLWGVFFSEAKIEFLYNCRQSVSGHLSISDIRVGQGDEWMRHWQWLSKQILPADALAAVKLAAQMLRSRILARGLLQAMQTGDPGVEELSLAVLRRWLLTLKAMAWLEHALQADWNIVRPQDLACLAFNAVKPEWPRRLVSVSHRSFEVKPLLQQTRAWKSPLFAIDALYVPAWETNTGMIWGLFALTPLITIVDSPNYPASEWCRRESELIHYLQSGCDFHPARQVQTISMDAVQDFTKMDEDWFIKTSDDNSDLSSFNDFNVLNNFPPLCNVYVPGTDEEWALEMLRFAGLLRVLLAIVNNPVTVNSICAFLINNDNDPPIPCYTNQPDGWAGYRKILRALQTGFAPATGPHLQFPATTALSNIDQNQKFLDKIPDLSTGVYAWGDVLVALEWQQSLLPVLEENSMGDMILIDLRGITKETWLSHPGYALPRGIAALREPPKPVWYIQNAGQDIEKWGLFGEDLPIFTQYTAKQYEWMWEGYFSPDWPVMYATDCGLEMSKELAEKCAQTRLG